MTDTQLDVSGCQHGHQGPALPFTSPLSTPPPLPLSLISHYFCFFCRLILRPRLKEQLEALSLDRLLGLMSKPMIYRTETDGEVE